MSDFVDDLNQRILTAMTRLGVCEQIAAMVTAELVMDMRRDWAGERPFIGRREADVRQTERNMAIIREWKAGKSIGAIARDQKLSRQRVWQIVNG